MRDAGVGSDERIGGTTSAAVTDGFVATATATVAARTEESEAVAGDPIDINVASAAEFEELPGIGPTLASRTVAYREANGPFGSVEGSEGVQGISERMVEEMRAWVTVGS